MNTGTDTGNEFSGLLSACRAVIFDMDGLIIDSEPLWREAEIEVFGCLGVELTDALCEQTMGWRIDEVVKHWYGRRPWTGPGVEEVRERILDRVTESIGQRGESLEGAGELIDLLGRKGYAMGLASSSPPGVISAVLEKLNLESRFQVTCSAIDESAGKPDPAVFLTAANRLKVVPSMCMVLEDSLSGVQAARAANMKVVAVPSANQFEDPRFETADLKVPALTHLLEALSGTTAVTG